MDLGYFDEVARLVGVLGLKITQNGELLAHQTWDEECRRNIYSATKSVTAVAVGFAVREGLLSLDEKLTDAFADSLPETVGENLVKATVRDLLTMCLGQGDAQLMAAQRPLYRERDWVKLALALPFPYAPGEKFVYSNVGPYLAGVLVQRRAKCGLTEYLTPRLFEPLGITRPAWETDPFGREFGAGGLLLTLSELHEFGLFCLQRGEYKGKRLLNAEWFDECFKKQGAGPYGYLFWLGEHDSVRIDGKYCQLSVLFPDKNAAITVVAECRHPDVLMRAIHDSLWPQLA